FVSTLLHFAEADLNPGFRATRISIGRRLKIVERVLIIAEPHRIDAAAIPKVGQRLRLIGAVLDRDLIKRNELTASQLPDAHRAQRQIYILAVGHLHGDDTDYLAAHVEKRTSAISMRDRRGRLNYPPQVRNFTHRRDDAIAYRAFQSQRIADDEYRLAFFGQRRA